ncbi:MAG: Xylulose kinase [Verrucomicrobiae bacterium]|nr:Xylulose kinase [Verrucomicrobiae bacterium]
MILAIDLGSTSFKAGLFDARLRLVRSNSAPLKYRYAAGGHVELEVPVVDAALRQIMAGMKGYKVIAITSQAQTFTVLNRRGQPTRPFVSWQDRRAARACAALNKQLPDFSRHCSFSLVPALQICQLKHAPIRRDETVLKLPSYAVHRWTGATVTDENIAAMGGLYSLAESRWWPPALRACGLRVEQLPRVVPVGTVAAHTPAGIPVILAGNDQTAGAYAARLDENGATLVTLGTAQVAYRCVEKLPAAGLVRGPYPGGRFYEMAVDSWGANLTNWAETILTGCETHDKFFAQAAQSPAGCHGLRFAAATGTWSHLALHHTAADLARSILEELSRRMAAMVRRVGGRRVLVAGGGGGRPVWRKILADELRMKLVRTEADPLLGAARMGKEAIR